MHYEYSRRLPSTANAPSAEILDEKFAWNAFVSSHLDIETASWNIHSLRDIWRRKKRFQVFPVVSYINHVSDGGHRATLATQRIFECW